MMQRILSGSRYMIIIAVLGAFLAAAIVLIYGGLTVIGIIIDVFAHHLFTTDGAKHLAIACIEIIDLFLLGTILYIIALGLLEPLKVKVYEVRGNSILPFADNQFDLVINRHEAYSVREVWRVLKPGGHFITQQVGGSNCVELNSLFGAPAYQYANWQLDYAIQELRDAGWHIVIQKEDRPIMRFFDVGAIIYYLKAIPWQVSDFSLEKYFDKLVALHNRIQQEQYLDVHNQRFLIIARKL